MMVRLGNFLFRYRNGIFPVAYAFVFAKRTLLFENFQLAALIGLVVALAGQFLRAPPSGWITSCVAGAIGQVYAEDLVTGGLFSHCRNPLYVGNYLILVGVGIASCSAIFVFVILPLMALAYRAIIAAEENFLRNKFGEIVRRLLRAGQPRLLQARRPGRHAERNDVPLGARGGEGIRDDFRVDGRLHPGGAAECVAKRRVRGVAPR